VRKRTTLSVSAVLIAGLAFFYYAQAALQTTSVNDHPVAEYRDTLNRYCVTCHNEKLRTAGLTLDLANVDDISESPAVWERVITKLSLKAMPPVGMPRPDDAFYEGLPNYLKSGLDAHAAANPNPGRTVTAHRLNRSEYENVIRDLLAVEIDGAAMLPADNSGGFDNLGDLLSVSQVLMEKYLAAAREISQIAIGASDIPVDTHQYTLDPRLLQQDRMSEELPFGSRGGLAVRHRFPLDGEYELSVRLLRTDDTALVIGIDEPNQLDVRVDGERVKLFEFGGENVGLALGAGRADKVPPDFEQAQYERLADGDLKVRFPMAAGTRTVQVTFLADEFAWEAPIPPPSYRNYSEARINDAFERAWAEPAVSSVTVTGPFAVQGPGRTESRQKIFICSPPAQTDAETGCAREILSRLARLAYRRPVDSTDIEPLLGLYRQARDESGSFEAGIQMALEGLLVSTEFLFRIERDPDLETDTIYAVSDLELASRLAFFLWSSIPDDELLTLAGTGQLREPGVLQSQVGRMLEDDRSESLVNSFAEQWLLLRNLPQLHKDQEVFPDFDENMREAMYKEVRLFVNSIFEEDRSVLDFLRADHTFLNERLARHYGIEGIYGNRFRRVVVPENQQGLLARAGILSITSYPTRNSTVLRGKWVLENILAAPPPPPPNDIPPLEDTESTGEVLTLREKMQIHPANPVCAVCHNQMDPIGFGLENYGAIGQWRTTDVGKPIDSSGRLPSGIEFQGSAELQVALLADPEVFANAFTQKLLTYALGRPLEYYDMPAVRKIVSDAADTDYRFSSIVLGTINSIPFQMRGAGS
jgi:hypothetical protein